MQHWNEWIDWAAKGFASFIAYQIWRNLSGLYHSIEHLNTKMAVVLERTLRHTKEIDKLDTRIRKVEDKI